jgi:hypothetical protein
MLSFVVPALALLLALLGAAALLPPPVGGTGPRDVFPPTRG